MCVDAATRKEGAMKGTARQINVLVAEIRSLLKKANATAWNWDIGQIERVEEMYVAFLVESAFRKSQMLFEMLELPETMAEVRKLAKQASSDYAATEYGEELYLKWPSKLEDFLEPIQPVESAVAPTTVEELADVLKRLPSGLKHWTWELAPKTKNSKPRKWEIDHEYHVQNLLWFFLAPLFPDAQRESYLPQVAGSNPRPDILIPSWQLVVEIKYLRRADKQEALVRAIAEDRSLYIHQGSAYKGILVFVWDDSRRSELHPGLIHGLKQIDDVVDAVVVSRPGMMQTKSR